MIPLDTTFKTGYDYTTFSTNENQLSAAVLSKDVKLSHLVNFVALRETFLSECPFINRGNKVFWKKCIDSQQFINMLSTSLNFILESVGENGTIYMDKLQDIACSNMLQTMSLNLAELTVSARKNFGSYSDNLFRKLPEILCFLLINAIHSCAMKHARVFNSAKFREILLDWLTEMIGGLRITNIRKDREWLFTDANDMKIIVLQKSSIGMTTTTEQLTTTNATATVGGTTPYDINDLTATKRFGLARPSSLHASTTGGASDKPLESTTPSRSNSNGSLINPNALGSAINHYTITNSPLINIYFKTSQVNATGTLTDRSSKLPKIMTSNAAVRVNLSNLPNRPLMSLLDHLQGDVSPTASVSASSPEKYRKKAMDHFTLQNTLNSSAMNRKKILNQLEINQHELSSTMKKIKEVHRIQMNVLHNPHHQVTHKQHQLLATMGLENQQQQQKGGGGGGKFSAHSYDDSTE